MFSKFWNNSVAVFAKIYKTGVKNCAVKTGVLHSVCFHEQNGISKTTLFISDVFSHFLHTACGYTKIHFFMTKVLEQLKEKQLPLPFFSGNMERNTAFPLFAGNHSHANSTCSRDNVLKNVVFPILYSFLFLVGMSLNGLAVWIFLRIPSQSHFIIYLKNIVVADVIMTFTFPFKVCHACIRKSKWVKDSLMVNYKIIGISQVICKYFNVFSHRFKF